MSTAASAPSATPRRLERRILGWSIVWGVLAVLHVTQGIWRSGGTAYPGDLGDGRFNQLVLEHGYQSLRGVYEWSSPGQFFPARNTLGYSDTHAGTLPIYAVVRMAGASMEDAWQAWFVIVGTLNVAATFWLFRALRVDGWLRGPSVFAAVSSATMVWVAGTHMQLLPVFPGILAWAQLVLWQRDRRWHRVAAASGWAAWQFAAGPYLAFFWVAITTGVAALRWATGGSTPRSDNEAGRGRFNFSAVRNGVVALAGWALFALVVSVYLKARQAGIGHPMSEVEQGTPDWRSWLTAPPIHAFYPAGWPGHHPDLVEHGWLAGFLPWLLVFVALAIGWKHRRSTAGSWMFALAGGVVITVLFFTQWGEHGFSPWLAVARQIEALHAFRESARVATLLRVVEIAAAALLLSHWQSVVARRWRMVPTVAAVLMAVEGLASGQPVTKLAVARARSDATIAAWRAAGDRPVLVYAFGYTDSTDSLLHLDAWAAALRLKKKTMNGYTGGIPGSHHRFIWNATLENARALMASTGLPPEQFSVIENLKAADKARLGIENFPTRPIATLDGFQFQPLTMTLFAPLERYVVGGRVMYQFTPPAELTFHLPDDVGRLHVAQAMRYGSYSGSGDSDGVGITWLIRLPTGAESVIRREYFNPRDNPAERGVVERAFPVPPGAGRTLMLRIDAGPAQISAWDWPLFGALEGR